MLEDALRSRGVAIAAAGADVVHVEIMIQPGVVPTGLADTRQDQAYRLTVSNRDIEVAGNSEAGVFHGLQTLIQLVESAPGYAPRLPCGVITDWPEYEWRFVHWDTKHHQDRMETLKRYLDEMARFKLNAVSFELEDKFEYPSHPEIGAPGAFTTAELAELTRYARDRHIELAPNVQAPAHLTYVLKHPRFAHLKCDGSNYQICMDEPEARQLLFDMYDDLCKATPGARFFHVSTDEVYYAGICEKFRKPYNAVNRSLTLVDYVNAAHAFLRERGRRVLIWAEFPLLIEHLRLLPPDIVDAIIGGDDAFIEEENRVGIRQLAYHPIQGAELVFPSYFGCRKPDGEAAVNRLAGAFHAARHGKATRGRPVGTFAAAWDDSGLHNETFWLGWATMAQCGWNPAGVHPDQSNADFMDVFYGGAQHNMLEAWREMDEAARFHEAAWESIPSRVRGPVYGSSKGKRPYRPTDLTLALPELPRFDGETQPEAFGARHALLLAQLPRRLERSEALTGLLLANLTRVRRNRHNLEVLLSLARFLRHHLQLLEAVWNVEGDFRRAHEEHAGGRHREVVASLERAARRLSAVLDDLREVFSGLQRTWEKSRLPRNAPAGGREFLHVMDDVKDHFADRRADLSYLIAPEESIGLPVYLDALRNLTRRYSAGHGVATTAGTPAQPMATE